MTVVAAAGWRDAARRRFSRSRSAARTGVATAVRAWRHSLQLRVGTTTALIAGTVVLIIGILLVDQVTSGILRAKKNAAVSQAQIGSATAARVLANVSASVSGDVEAAQDEIKS